VALLNTLQTNAMTLQLQREGKLKANAHIEETLEMLQRINVSV
jgi:hypothetical protein